MHTSIPGAIGTLFGLDMAVEWRHDPKGDGSNVNNEPARPV